MPTQDQRWMMEPPKVVTHEAALSCDPCQRYRRFLFLGVRLHPLGWAWIYRCSSCLGDVQWGWSSQKPVNAPLLDGQTHTMNGRKTQRGPKRS